MIDGQTVVFIVFIVTLLVYIVHRLTWGKDDVPTVSPGPPATPEEPVATIVLTAEQTQELAKLLDAYYDAPANRDRAARFAVWRFVEEVSGYSDVEWVHSIREDHATQYAIVVKRRKVAEQ